jgi:hypothetical protein
MAMAAELLGSWHTSPCRGLRIPLMFQLTIRNILENWNAPRARISAGKMITVLKLAGLRLP